MTLLKQTNRCLDINNQSKGVLFQFIMNEFISSFQETKDIEQLYRTIESKLITHHTLDDIKDLLQQLFFSLSKLTGTTIDDEPQSPWSSDKGSLNKLRHFCHMLSSKSSTHNAEVANFNVCVSKCYHSALQGREVILSLERPSPNVKKRILPNYPALYQFLDKLIDNMHRSSRLLLHLISQFHDDENVVLFLIQHREEFEKIFKSKFITKIFGKMFQNGIKDAEKLLKERYTKRGFQDSIKKIAESVHT